MAEIQECWRRKYASILHVKVDELSELHPLYQRHRLIALRDLPVGALLCGTELAAFARGSAYLFHNSPNVVRALLFNNSSNTSWRGHFSWNTLELLSYRLEGVIFSSVLLSEKTHRWRTTSNWYPSPNIVLHFLGNGLTCGEVIQEISAGEALVRHFSTGVFTWDRSWRTRGWISKSSEEQATILFEEEEECDEYFADCASHDEDDSRAELVKWYREDTFNRLAKLCAAEIAQEEQAVKDAEAEEAELLRMRACDVNALPQP